jgi:hypothetical protein
MEHRWNEIDKEKQNTRGKTSSSANLYTKNITWTDPGSNPDLCAERPVTNRRAMALPLRNVMSTDTYFHNTLSPQHWSYTAFRSLPDRTASLYLGLGILLISLRCYSNDCVS